MTLGAYLKEYASAGYTRLHMPGHKGSLSPLDLTETEYGAEGDIEDAVFETECGIGRAYGCGRAVLLSGGSTLGILSAIYALPRGRILVPRASHKSVWSACVLAGREPVVIETPDKDGLALAPTDRDVARALETAPDAVGAVITSPDYYGRTADLCAIRSALGGRALVADAAHGAHFGLRPEFPPSPAAWGDMTVLSAHKTLKSLTQSAFALVRPEFLSRFLDARSLFATTSPSYLLYASVESGVAHARETDCLPLIREILKLPFRIPVADPMRIVIDAFQAGMSGTALAEILGRGGIVTELANERAVVGIVTACDTVETVRKFGLGLKSFASEPIEKKTAQNPIGEAAEPFLYFGETEEVPLSCAVGRIAAREVGFYPPCLSNIIRGERFSADLIDALETRSAFGIDEGRVAVRK